MIYDLYQSILNSEAVHYYRLGKHNNGRFMVRIFSASQFEFIDRYFHHERDAKALMTSLPKGSFAFLSRKGVK
jgi:hypothetical protein